MYLIKDQYPKGIEDLYNSTVKSRNGQRTSTDISAKKIYKEHTNI